MFNLTEEEIERYSRHIILPEVGGRGQQKLKEASVLVVGAGGLGSPALLYLTAAGVGRIGIIEDDVVDLTNLQRQVLHATADVGKPKAQSASETMKQINPLVEVDVYRERLNKDNILPLVEKYDVVVDGVDNFPTRYLINDACVMKKKALVEGGILRFMGLIMSIRGGETACYRCVYEEPPPPGTVPSCAEAGILGAVAGVVGTLQATEVLKILTGVGKPLFNRMLQFDAEELSFHEVQAKRNPKCPVCGENPTITELVEYDHTCEIQAPGS
ncbi:putative adenylyltransferase/sulfurtransferase MoeZ [bacterium BMS3Abin01]|nr:putative adenylyltransferase/sulfurtransferase MoeZ [bacterium BMS3Abin01]HDZ59837.1 molybdopterin-synthase adenylyltransferase MoeB [Actinomycetota bacterium]